MANSEGENQLPFPPIPKNVLDTQNFSQDNDEEDDSEEVEDDEENEEQDLPARVHDVLIRGNTKTKDWVIEAEVEEIKNATTMLELVKAARIANAKLHSLQIFDAVNIKLEPGPPELAGTANVIIEVSETNSKPSGEVGVYSKPAASSWSLEGALKFKNLLGYGDLWDGSLAYGPNQTSEEFDVRYAIPFRFSHTALNLGISAGVIFPWGHGFLNKPSPLPERFFLGGDFSPVCALGGPTTLWGFRTRAFGPSEPRRQSRDGKCDDNVGSFRRDFVGGDLSVTAFADLSFDLPIGWLRELGIHGHVFACAGNIAKLAEIEYRKFSAKKISGSISSICGMWNCYSN